MKKIILSIVFVATVLLTSCGGSSNEVTIGNQVWMVGNLNVDKFRNGDPIPEAKTVEEWKKAEENKQPSWCYYNNDTSNGAKYGKLYNWYAVNDPRDLTPEGWHIPADTEWMTLVDYLGGRNEAGIKMKSTFECGGIGYGNNESGFSALPGGIRGFMQQFYHLGQDGCWWSSTEQLTSSAWGITMYCSNGAVDRIQLTKDYGLAVRCLKD